MKHIVVLFVAISSAEALANSQVPRRVVVPSLTPISIADDEAEFSAWLSDRLSTSAGVNEHADLFADCHAGILRWRRRYRGNPRLWRALFKGDKVVKEIVEAAPVLAAARELVHAAPSGETFTIVDLCSGKGFLSMVLSELLPPDRVARCVLVDKAWPPFDWEGPIAEHHISTEHIYGEGEVAGGYFSTWPIPLYTSKQDLKNRATLRGLRARLFDKCEGPVLVLAVHLCGTLALRAVDLFNDHEKVRLLALKPCCLPPMLFAKPTDERPSTNFTIGSHTFDAREVCAPGRFRAGGVWDGPPRADLIPRFERWSDHLLRGIDLPEAGAAGRKAQLYARVQLKGGYQNRFIFAERGAHVTEALWERIDAASTRSRSGAHDAPERLNQY